MAFRKLIIQDYFDETNTGNQNCEPDMEEILKLNVGRRFDEEESVTTMQKTTLKDCDYHFHTAEQNAIRYICGYLIRKCLLVHSCSECEKYANEHKSLDNTSIYSHFRAYQTKNCELFGKLYMPNDSLFFFTFVN